MASPRIVVDLLSGDHPPESLLPGLLQCAADFDVSLIGIVPFRMEAQCADLPQVKWIFTDEFVRMDEAPSVALRRLKQPSIGIATQMLAHQEVDALFSPGHTGATLTAAIMQLKRIEGIRRPAIATVLSGSFRPKILVDSGANAQCKVEHLVQFAIMGLAYARHKLKVPHPKIGLLNIGAEPYKGTELYVDTFKRLSKLSLDFVGNVEPNQLLDADIDVIVCDGFTGNIVLKLLEGVFRRLHKWEPQVQGAPLLGVAGLVMVGHGATTAEDLVKAIDHTAMLVKRNMIREITESVQKLSKIYKKYLP